MHIGEVIKEVITQKKITQSRLARKTNLTDVFINQVLKCKQTPSNYNLRLISKAVDLPPLVIRLVADNIEEVPETNIHRFQNLISILIENHKP